MQLAQERNIHSAGPKTAFPLPTHFRPLTGVSQATGHIAAQTGHLLPRNLGPASIIPYQSHHWDLQGEDEARPQPSVPGLGQPQVKDRDRTPANQAAPSPAHPTPDDISQNPTL